MWTEKSLKERIIENNGFNFEGLLTKFLPLAIDITEDPQKMPYAFTEISSDPITKVQVRAISAGDLPSNLTVRNYNAMLKCLEEDFKRNPQDFKVQQSHGFRLMIDFDNGGRPTTNVANLFRIYTTVHEDTYCLSLSFGSEGYEAYSGPSKIRLNIRCEDFLGPNKHTFT